jgi:hypothetical protein
MKKMVLFSALLFGLTVSSFSQTPRVTKRQIKQERRIQEGKASGELTPTEAARLQAEQRDIQQDKRAAKADGVVTPAERRELRKEQRQANRHIRHQKHDRQTR